METQRTTAARVPVAIAPPQPEPPTSRFIPPEQRGAGFLMRRFFRNFLGCWPLILGLMTFVPLVTPMVLINRDGWGMRTAYRLFQWWCKATARGFGVRMWASGLENVDPARSYIVAVNHRSHFDLLMLGPLLPVYLVAIYKKSLDYVPFIGQALVLSRSVGLKRNDRTDAKRRLGLVGHRIALGRSVLIFPEGTRSKGPTLDRFKKGAAVVALEQGAPVLPITILGTDAIYTPGKLMVNSGEVRIIIHPPVETRGRPMDDREALTAELEAIIGGAFRPGPTPPQMLTGVPRFV